jgi:ribose 5-phosphate isomerase A
MGALESAKQKCSYDAVEQQVTKDMHVIGIGSGSTVVYAVERLGQLQKAGKIHVKACIPSSFQAQQLILKNDLPLGTLNQYPEIDITIDGADEIDDQLNCIKGGGGCHLQEKLNIVNSKKFIIVADYTKKSTKLGTVVIIINKWNKGIPLEVIPLAYVSVQKQLEKLNGKAVLRMATAKAGDCI